MRVLVTYGSRMGGTAGIAEQLGAALTDAGLEVDVLAAGRDVTVEGYDAVIVGGGLYANRWQADARRFVKRHASALRERPVWLFSSGPLDDGAAEHDIPATRMVADLAEKVGARGHTTFGGRLPPDAKGFPASAMAKEHAGDWRDPAQIGAWALQIVNDLRALQPK